MVSGTEGTQLFVEQLHFFSTNTIHVPVSYFYSYAHVWFRLKNCVVNVEKSAVVC